MYFLLKRKRYLIKIFHRSVLKTFKNDSIQIKTIKYQIIYLVSYSIRLPYWKTRSIKLTIFRIFSSYSACILRNNDTWICLNTITKGSHSLDLHPKHLGSVQIRVHKSKKVEKVVLENFTGKFCVRVDLFDKLVEYRIEIWLNGRKNTSVFL